MGLTGTASRSVLKDVRRELDIQDFDALITPSSFDRKELKFKVFECSSEEKLFRLKGILEILPGSFGKDRASFFEPHSGQCGIVFCPHVNGEYGTYIIDMSCDGGPVCPGDADGDDIVGINDFLLVLATWGTDPGGPPDFDGDGIVGINDFLFVLANWGPC